MAIFWVAFLHVRLLGSVVWYLFGLSNVVCATALHKNWFLEIAYVFQSVWTRKKIEKYDSQKLQGSEGSNPNRTHGSGSVQVRKFCRRFRFRFGQKGVWTGLNRTSATLIETLSTTGSGEEFFRWVYLSWIQLSEDHSWGLIHLTRAVQTARSLAFHVREIKILEPCRNSSSW